MCIRFTRTFAYIRKSERTACGHCTENGTCQLLVQMPQKNSCQGTICLPALIACRLALVGTSVRAQVAKTTRRAQSLAQPNRESESLRNKRDVTYYFVMPRFNESVQPRLSKSAGGPVRPETRKDESQGSAYSLC